MRNSTVIDSSGANSAGAVQSAFSASKRRVEINLSFSYSRPRLIGVGLFLAVAFAFYYSPVHYLSDSGFSLLMDEALIHEWTPNMIRYQVPRGHGGIFVNDGYPWNLEIIKGRLLYAYPWGSSLLSLPLVAVFNADGFKIAPHRNGYKYDYSKELRMQTIIATGVCAFTIWVVYQAAGHLLPLGWSLAIALGTAFGTPIWSSASRSLWPQTWAVLLMMIAIWTLLSGSVRPFLLGSVLAWSCLVRPQVIPDVAAITGYVLVRYDLRFLGKYIVAGLGWAIPLCGMMFYFTGGLFSPWYTPVLLDFPHDFWFRLYGVLLSPSRGFLVFSPVAFVSIYLTIHYWRSIPNRGLAILAIVIIGMHVVMLSSFINWWGGGSYGPRLLLEIVPWFVLLTILGVRPLIEDYSLSPRRRLLTSSLAALTLAISIVTNAPGALDQNSISWKSFDPDHLGVLWDWRDPQFLCWIRRLQN
jgi:hypothetical protein